MDHSQTAFYKQLRSKLSLSGYSYLSENNLLRYLSSSNWNVDDAFNKLLQAEQWRVDNDCMKIEISSVYEELAMKVSNYLFNLYV